MQFDGCRRSVLGRPTFNHIGIQGSLSEEFGVLDVLRSGFEALDELIANRFSFLLRVRHPGQFVQEQVFRFNHP